MHRLLGGYAVAGALLIACAAPARAEVVVVENEAQLEILKTLFKASQEQYLRTSRAMEPCYQNRHEKCADEMREAIPNLPSAIQVAGGITEFLEPIRNNAFRYERAFTLLLLNAIVQARNGGSCGDFRIEAERALADNRVVGLGDHLANAEAEIGGRTYLPEFQMLQRVRSVLGPCVGR